VAVLISVIVPVHDGERFVGEALEAIAAQTYKTVEMIVIDDGSHDDSVRIAKAALRASGRGVVHQQPQRGVAAARNAGLALANGELLAFCDHDDVWLADKLERQVDYLDAHPDTGAVMTRQEPFFEDGIVEPPPWLKRDKVYGDLGGILQLSALIRREAFDVVGGFAESRHGADDLDWFFRARRKGVGIDILPEILVRRRVHAHNASYDTDMVRRGLMESLHALTHERADGE
jgi:glycosyltransferase involved in cell wall biosynthesis